MSFLKFIFRFLLGFIYFFSGFYLAHDLPILFTEKSLEKVNIFSAAQENKLVQKKVKKSLKNNHKSNIKKKCSLKVDLSILPAENRKKILKIAQIFGCDKLRSLRKIELYSDQDLPRALANGNLLKIRQDALTLPEFENLIIHEFSHVIDLGFLRGSFESGESNFKDGSLPVFKNDLSLQFYKISWEDSETKKSESDQLDFVTGYAQTDPFEDFAESMLFYIKHNREFRILAKNNKKLRKKFNFIQKKIFAGKIFKTGKNFINPQERSWDATKI